MKYKIEFRKRERGLFLSFWKKFEPKISKLKNVIIENNCETMVLTYEINKDTKITQRVIKLWLADAIVSYYKEQYLLKKLSFPNIDGLSLEVVVKAITMFDKASDVGMVIEKIKKSSYINVYSLYIFKMSDIRARWQEICEVLKMNMYVLSNSDIMIELMRYLISVSENSIPYVYLYQEAGFWVLKSENNQILGDSIPITEKGSSIKLVLELISFSPQKILIKCSEQLTSELQGFLDNLFPSKVVYCT